MNVDSHHCHHHPVSYFESNRIAQSATSDGGLGGKPPAASRRAEAAQSLKAPEVQEKVTLLSVWPEGHVGDQHQSAGIADAIKIELIRRSITSVERVAETRAGLKDLPTEAQVAALDLLCKGCFGGWAAENFDKLIVIGAGSGSNVATTLGALSGHPRVTTVFSGHQWASNLVDGARLPDIVALPAGVMTSQQLAELEGKTELLLVAGVANQLTRQQIAATAAAYKAKGYPAVPVVDADTVAVILGGDAPDTSGRERLVTETSARSLARHIVAQEKPHDKTTFIVTNGPRTGKHAVDENGNALGTHRSDSLDPITAAFIDELGKLTTATIHLFDFQFGKLPSAYMPIIDQYLEAGEKAGHFYVPAESSSMVSETGLLLNKRVISVTESTNPSHMNIVSEELSRTGGTVLHLNGKTEHIMPIAGRPSRSAASEIADAVLARIWPTKTGGSSEAVKIEASFMAVDNN